MALSKYLVTADSRDVHLLLDKDTDVVVVADVTVAVMSMAKVSSPRLLSELAPITAPCLVMGTRRSSVGDPDG